MKEILLTQDKIALVDDWWYDYLMQWKWYAFKCDQTYYAVRNSNNKDGTKYYKRNRILMHRIIMNTPDNLLCDHQDHNGLNCQENNMRNCNNTQNAINHIYPNKSGYRGVSFHKGIKKYAAQISIHGKIKHLGYFSSSIEAAKKYDKYAKKYHGEFAITNF